MDAPNSLLLNDGGGQFSEAVTNIASLNNTSFGSAVGDFNNDGYQDIGVLNNSPDLLELWQNGGGSNNWLKIGLVGTTSNRDGIGSIIEVIRNEMHFFHSVQCGISYKSQNGSHQHIGLNDAALVDTIIVTWLSGIRDTLINVQANQKIMVMEGEGMMLTPVKLKVLLQAAYLPDGLMNTALAGMNSLPYEQPYKTEPWRYAGVEAPTSFPPQSVDWVLVEAKHSNTPQTLVQAKAGLLRSDGIITNVNGDEWLEFTNLMPGESYHFVVKHRNHLNIRSNAPIMVPNATVFDLTQAANVANGGTQMQLMPNGSHALKAGNFDGNNIIYAADYAWYKSQMSQINDYLSADCSLDGKAVVDDYNYFLMNFDANGDW